MRRRLAKNRITLKREALPPGWEYTELNYRTRVTTDAEDRRTVFYLVGITIILSFALGVVSRVSAIPYFLPAILIITAYFFGRNAYRALWRFLCRRPTLDQLALLIVLAAFATVLWYVNQAPSMEAAYLVIFAPAILVTAVFSHVATVNVCHFMAVNERIRLRHVRRWQNVLRYIWSLESPRVCPEVASYRMSYFALVPALAIGYIALLFAASEGFEDYAAMFGVLAFVATLFFMWIGAETLRLSRSLPIAYSMRVAAQSVVTLLCYNRHQIQAPGLFKFPTRAFRKNSARDWSFGLMLGLITIALVCVSMSAPSDIFEKFRRMKEAPLAGMEIKLTPAEQFHVDQLPEERRAEMTERYLRWRSEDMQEPTTFVIWAMIRYLLWNAPLVLAFSLCGAPLVLLSVHWFLGGRLLTAFYDALEAPDAFELPPVPTHEEILRGETGITVWDNRIERLRRSRNPVETEHFWVGISIEGDYPILVHRQIYETHCHVLGDTGCGKTSYALAPTLTQIIDRGLGSVLVLDLKGDDALFTATRVEAERAGIPFKWFTNLNGRSSYVFNPLSPANTARQSVDQLTYSLLEAIGLQYGEGYGRAYFTAMNEVVLSTYLRYYRQNFGTFKELAELAANRNTFKVRGNENDWEMARHLVIMLDKLGQLAPLNVSAPPPGSPISPNLEGQLKAQIEVPELLRKRQVFYFYLSAGQQKTTVAPVARLALSSLLAAAFNCPVEDKARKEKVYVYIDEFQMVVGENLRTFLTQARSYGLYFFLANQSIKQLADVSPNLVDLVDSCTSYKQFYKAGDRPTLEYLLATSGEALYHELQWTEPLSDRFDSEDDEYLGVENRLRYANYDQAREHEGYVDANVREVVGPRLQVNTIIDTSAATNQCFTKFTASRGFTQFSAYWTTTRMEHHIHEIIYKFRENYPEWPCQTLDTLIVRPDEKPANLVSRFLEDNPKPAGSRNAGLTFDGDIDDRINRDDDPLNPTA